MMKKRKARVVPFEERNNSAGFADEGIIITDWSLKPIALDSGAEGLFDDDDGPAHASNSRESLPQEILNQLRGRPPADLHDAQMHVKVGAREYNCRTFVVKAQIDDTIQPMLVLYFKRETSLVDAVRQVAADYGLTDREEEALVGISMGLTSKELAVRMNISPNTVKAFLRLVMIKMGATTRAGIVGKLLDVNGRTGDGWEKQPHRGSDRLLLL